MAILVDLSKKAKVSLEKKNIFGEKAEVVLYMDTSISMERRYQNGTVQNVVERLLGLAMNLDDNESIDVCGFDVKLTEAPNATPANHASYVDDILLKKVKQLGGGTHYAPAIRKAISDYGNKPETVAPVPAAKGFLSKLLGKNQPAPNSTPLKPRKMPVYILFVTDGENQDRAATEAAIKEASRHGIFFQFVGIGNEQFNFLQKLDDLQDRVIDNADFFKISDITSMSDEELYDRILNEFPSWLNEARSKGILE